MFKQRVLTALLLGPISIWATLALPSHWFAGILAAVFILGAWEWGGLARLGTGLQRLAYAVLFATVMFALLINIDVLHVIAPATIFVACVWWLLAFVFVVLFPRGSQLWYSSPVAIAVAGLLSLWPAWIAIVTLHTHVGPGYTLLLFFLVWGADIGAYFAGRTFGRRKLAPAVSPGKTWAGVGGALVATVLITLPGLWVLQQPKAEWLVIIFIALLAVAFSIVGDLSESMFKRMANLKDSGNILPGHGGMLDRIDSLCAAAPVFAAGLLWRGLL
ncbi:MAG: phosphatidate cytidylyltransferase [Thiohalomonadaceae bacterium]